MPSIFTKLKFWTLAIGVVLVVLRHYVPDFPITDEVLTGALLLGVAWLIGQPLQDGIRGLFKR